MLFRNACPLRDRLGCDAQGSGDPCWSARLADKGACVHAQDCKRSLPMCQVSLALADERSTYILRPMGSLLSDRLRRARNAPERKITHQAIADRLGKERATIALWESRSESSRTSPSIADLNVVAEMTGAPIWYLADNSVDLDAWPIDNELPGMAGNYVPAIAALHSQVTSGFKEFKGDIAALRVTVLALQAVLTKLTSAQEILDTQNDLVRNQNFYQKGFAQLSREFLIRSGALETPQKKTPHLAQRA